MYNSAYSLWKIGNNPNEHFMLTINEYFKRTKDKLKLHSLFLTLQIRAVL